MRSRRDKVGFLCLLLVAGGGWIALASRSDGQASEPGVPSGSQSKDSGFQTSAFRPQTPGSSPSFLSDPNLVSSPGAGLGSGGLFFRMMLSVVLVVGLGGVALYLSKRVLPRVVQPGGREIHILETTGLGPRKALHLVEVGGQRLLIASTHDRITMLTPLSEAWPELPKSEVGEEAKA